MKKNIMRFLAIILAMALTVGLSACETPDADTTGQSMAADASSATGESSAGDPESFDGTDLVFDVEAGKGKFCIYFLNTPKDYVNESGITHAGDSVLLTSPDGKTMMIDLNNGANDAEIIASLQRLGIEKLDYLVFSHPHVDHINGYRSLFRYVSVDQCYMNAEDYSENSTAYTDLIKTLKAKNVPVTILWEGDTITFGDEITVDIMNPPRDYDFTDDRGVGTASIANNGSIAMLFHYGEATYFTGGDLYQEGEDAFLERYPDFQADIAKLNHHGRSTSNSKAWVERIRARLVCPQDNAINSDVVWGRFRKNGAITVSATLDGASVVRCSPDGTYELQVQKLRSEENENSYGSLRDLGLDDKGYMTFTKKR